MTASSIILSVKNLQVTRGGVLVLDIPDLHLKEGEILSLIGPNGAGKTSLLLALALLLKNWKGEIHFRGEGITTNPSALKYRRCLTLVFQEPLLFDTTVFENVALGLRIRGWEKGKIQTSVEDNLKRFGISHLRQRSARKISGGEAHRVALARAFATQPEILFLDEPFSALDPPTRESLIEDLSQALRDTGTTTVFATHDRMEALRLSDRIAVMHGGKILQVGPAWEVMNRPADEFVANFVGIETILSGKVTQTGRGTFVASVMGKELEAVGEARIGETVVLCIRPENVTLSENPFPHRTSARNVFPGRIRKIAPLGLFYRIELDCGFPLVSYITHQSMEKLSLMEGKNLTASFKATAIHVVRKKS